MNKKLKFVFFSLLWLAVALLVVFFPYDGNIAVLNPKGLIALKQKNLLIAATLLMLIVVVPVFIMTFLFAWKYRERNEKAKYAPNWDYNLLAESIWWGLPLLIIIVLSVMTWKSSHELDPFKPLESSKKPLTIQAISLQWKWLFIYPEENIATVNFIQFPKDTPINFELTSDAPMNSFWIPQLGGQIYTMPGMKTKLHLIAHEDGSFRGSSANLSGEGFAGMAFTAKASSEAEFASWVSSVKQSSSYLNQEVYNQLVLPSKNNPVTFYILEEKELFEEIVMKYMERK